jgi:hypothetical protein
LYHYNPRFAARQPEKIQSMLTKNNGQEEKLMARLEVQYGPEKNVPSKPRKRRSREDIVQDVLGLLREGKARVHPSAFLSAAV